MVFFIYNFAGMQDFKAVCRFRKGEVWWFYLFIYLFGGSVTGLVFSARCAAYWHAPFTFGSLSVFWMLSHMLSLFCFSACGYVNGTLPCRTWSRMFAKKKNNTHPWTPSSLKTESELSNAPYRLRNTIVFFLTWNERFEKLEPRADGARAARLLHTNN